MSDSTSATPTREVAESYDLFVAFAESDRGWVEGYLLPALGPRSGRIVTQDDFRPGAALIDEVERAVRQSRLTAVVLSSAFLADEWSSFGELLASHSSIGQGSASVVPILVEPCELPPHIGYRVTLDCTEPARWEAEVGRLRQLLDRPEPLPEDIPCPYPGMVPFREHTGYFYGREEEEKALLLRLRNAGSFFVIGPSGSGKSSLVFAGLLPRLARTRGPRWLVRTLRPGAHPLGALGEALGEGVGGGAHVDAELVRRVLERAPPAERLLLVVDQLEEVFAQAPAAERLAFLSALASLRRLDSCVLVATLRADFYPDFMTSDLWPVAESERVEIAPLRGERLRRAIEQPAREVGVHLEPALVERLLADAAEEPGVLPLVQETMVLLWEQRRRRLLTLDAYEALGSDGRSGLAVALATRADATLNDLAAPQREIARRIFLRLVQLGEGRDDTRRQEHVEALHAEAEDPADFGHTLDHLTERRLLILSGEPGGQLVDLAHESLIAGWRRLRQWIDEDRDSLRIQRQVATDATQWEELRDPSLLYSGTRLHAAREWAESHGRDVTAPERAFIKASQAREVAGIEATRRTNRRLRLLVRGLAGALVVTLLATGAAVWGVVQAQRQTEAAQRETNNAVSQALAAQSTSDLASQPDRSLLLGVQALHTAPTGQAEHALFDALQRDLRLVGFLPRSAPGGGGVAVSPDGSTVAAGNASGGIDLWKRGAHGVPQTLANGSSRVEALAFSPDGKLLAAGDDARTVAFWDVAQGRRLGSGSQHTERVTSLAFSPDGKLLATGSEDKTIVLWDTSSLRPVATLLAYGNGVGGVVFTPDGRRLLVGGLDGVQLWDAGSRAIVSRWGQKSGTSSLALSPDGAVLATAGFDGVTLWNAGTGERLADLTGQTGTVRSLAFSADGMTLASGADNGLVALWDVAKHKSAQSAIATDGTAVTGLAFARDGTLAVGGSGKLASLWDPAWSASLARPLRVTGRHESVGIFPVGTIARSPDDRLAAWTEYGAVIVWDVVRRQQVAEIDTNAGSAHSLAFSPDDKTLAAGTSGQVVLLWDVAHLDRQPAVLRGPKDSINAVAFSPDGRMLAAASDDTAVHVWSLGKRQLVSTIPGPDALTSVAFRPDSKGLAFGSVDGSITLWDLNSGAPIGNPLRKQSGAVRGVAFNPDGRRLASGGADGTVVVWNVDQRAPLHSLLGHTAAVRAVAFAPDGRTLASGGEDGIILWDATGASRLADLMSGGAVSSLAFDRAGHNLLTGGDNVVLWNVDVASLRSRACAMAGRNLTQAEWDQFVGSSRHYERTCPAYPSGTGAPANAPAARD